MTGFGILGPFGGPAGARFLKTKIKGSLNEKLISKRKQVLTNSFEGTF